VLEKPLAETHDSNGKESAEVDISLFSPRMTNLKQRISLFSPR